MTSNTPISSRELDRIVHIGGKFLRALSTKPMIKQQMALLGYTEAEHASGWELYLAMLGYGPGNSTNTARKVTTEQERALSAIDDFDEPAFRRAKVALTRLHPEQAAYLFADGLAPKSGAASVSSVQTFLDRYAALRDGSDPARTSKRDADQAAARTLESRNIITPEQEKQLRTFIEQTQLLAPTPDIPVVSANDQKLQLAAEAFKTWLADWRPTAQIGIRRRDYRIQLGVAQRRGKSDETEVEETEDDEK